MSNSEIKEQIDRNNQLIVENTDAASFELNKYVSELLEENSKLRSQCTHEFKDGYCIYCYKKE